MSTKVIAQAQAQDQADDGWIVVASDKYAQEVARKNVVQQVELAQKAIELEKSEAIAKKKEEARQKKIASKRSIARMCLQIKLICAIFGSTKIPSLPSTEEEVKNMKIDFSALPLKSSPSKLLMEMDAQAWESNVTLQTFKDRYGNTRPRNIIRVSLGDFLDRQGLLKGVAKHNDIILPWSEVILGEDFYNWFSEFMQLNFECSKENPDLRCNWESFQLSYNHNGDAILASLKFVPTQPTFRTNPSKWVEPAKLSKWVEPSPRINIEDGNQFPSLSLKH